MYINSTYDEERVLEFFTDSATNNGYIAMDRGVALEVDKRNYDKVYDYVLDRLIWERKRLEAVENVEFDLEEAVQRWTEHWFEHIYYFRHYKEEALEALDKVATESDIKRFVEQEELEMFEGATFNEITEKIKGYLVGGGYGHWGALFNRSITALEEHIKGLIPKFEKDLAEAPESEIGDLLDELKRFAEQACRRLAIETDFAYEIGLNKGSPFDDDLLDEAESHLRSEVLEPGQYASDVVEDFLYEFGNPGEQTDFVYDVIGDVWCKMTDDERALEVTKKLGIDDNIDFGEALFGDAADYVIYPADDLWNYIVRVVVDDYRQNY